MIDKKQVQVEINKLLAKELNWNNIKQLNELYRLLGYIYSSEKMKDEFTGHEVYDVEEPYAEQILTKGQAMKWVYNMKNEDGSSGQHWNMDQTNSVLKNHSYDLDPVEFYVVMNMLYSDFGSTLSGLGLTEKNSDAYARLAKAWLCDEDSVYDKLLEYKKHIVK